MAPILVPGWNNSKRRQLTSSQSEALAQGMVKMKYLSSGGDKGNTMKSTFYGMGGYFCWGDLLGEGIQDAVPSENQFQS